MKLKRYKNKKIVNCISFILFIIFISLGISLVIINYFSKKANEILFPMAESKVRKVVTMIINGSCNEDMIDSQLYEINRNSNNEIEMITYNSFKVTKLINDVTLNIENMIRDIETGKINLYGDDVNVENGIIAEIPFGVIYGNSLLSGVGPKLKLRLDILGDVTSNLETEVKPYGINNAYVEVRIQLEITARILLPFVSEKVVISQVIPISMNVVNGSVPEGYIYSYK